MSSTINVVELPLPESRAAAGPQRASVGGLLRAASLSATVLELLPGERIAPYHFDYGNEACALILGGRPTLRDAEGEHQLEPGDFISAPAGPAGAHELSNDATEPCRILVLETTNRPRVTVYPDDGTLLVDPPGRVFSQADSALPPNG